MEEGGGGSICHELRSAQQHKHPSSFYPLTPTPLTPPTTTTSPCRPHLPSPQTTKANLQRRIAERTADVSSRRAALAALAEQNAALAERVAGQALSKADVARMQAERCVDGVGVALWVGGGSKMKGAGGGYVGLHGIHLGAALQPCPGLQTGVCGGWVCLVCTCLPAGQPGGDGSAACNPQHAPAAAGTRVVHAAQKRHHIWLDAE